QQWSEQVLELGGEDGDTHDAGAVELAPEPARDPLAIALQGRARLVRKFRPPLLELSVGPVEKRPRVRGEIAPCRHNARIEADVQADGAVVPRAEGCKLAQLLPCDRFRHAEAGFYACAPALSGTSIRPESFNTADTFLERGNE